MSKLYHINSAYSLVNTLYGIEANTDEYEDLALTAWGMINNKHTRLYRYIADVEHGELILPCNVQDVESVHIPLTDAPRTSNLDPLYNYEAILIERYIDSFPSMDNPFNQRGKYVKYKEGGDRLYFDRDYKNVMVVYHGVIADEEDGLPMINEREMNAIAAFIAYRETYKDILRRRDINKATMAIVQDLKEDWLRKCNAARIVDHLSQNDMNDILDVKSRWDRKVYSQSFIPMK